MEPADSEVRRRRPAATTPSDRSALQDQLLSPSVDPGLVRHGERPNILLLDGEPDLGGGGGERLEAPINPTLSQR